PARFPCMTHRLDEMTRRRRIVLLRVGDAQPATGAELARLEPDLVTELGQQAEDDVHRLLVRAKREDLRPDVRVQADEIQPRMLQRSLHRLAGGARLDRETELGV